MVEIEKMSLAQLRTHKSEKFRNCDPDVLPLPVAEMDFAIASPIRETLVKMAMDSDTGYLGSIPELGENLASFAQKKWGWKIETDNVFVAADVGVAMVEMARTVVNPGDKILINSPVYHNFYNWVEELKCEVYDAPLLQSELDYSLDFSAIEAGYKAGVKIHFLCSPHNPVGALFTRDELAQLAELAKKYGVAIFSDEVHGPLVYSDSNFVPFLTVSDTAREVGICTTAASKSWNIAGLKSATIVVGSSYWRDRAQTMPKAVHYRASLFGAHAAAVAYSCDEWLEAVLKILDGNRKFLADQLLTKLPQVRYRIPDATYLAWLDLSELRLGDNPAERLLVEGRVSFSPGVNFSPRTSQFVRLNFATSEAVISEAIDRVAAVVNRG